MSVTGVAGTLSAHSVHLPTRESRLSNARVSACSMLRMPRGGNFLGVKSNSVAQGVSKQCRRRINMVNCAMDASFGDAMNNQFDVFPRINIKDPYKRLGISSEASEEEIQAARNFLLQRYAGHQPSVDAIEAAHNKIIMQQFHERRRPKLHIKKKVRDLTQSRYVQAVMNRFRNPADAKFIVKTAIAFLVLGVLTVLFPTEEGPTLQGWSIYFLMARWYLSDGIYHSSNTTAKRVQEFRSDVLIDNLCASLGSLYISEIVLFASSKILQVVT
ncbi:hypothetical protein KSS87_008662 [Heliosperma pusillum]|nr:hypothetical protein KSS87_008662 [Heliosperma pusillum]